MIVCLRSPGGEMVNAQLVVVDGGWTETKYLSPRTTGSRWIETGGKPGLERMAGLK